MFLSFRGYVVRQTTSTEQIDGLVPRSPEFNPASGSSCKKVLILRLHYTFCEYVTHYTIYAYITHYGCGGGDLVQLHRNKCGQDGVRV